MPKDNEKVPLFSWTTDEPDGSALSPFAPEQMLRCDECLRANPPTRLNCLYCAATLPHNEATAQLQKPTLRPLEKWEQGYNNILLRPVANPTEKVMAALCDLLLLQSEELSRILAAAKPLPLARASTLEEAKLIRRRLSSFGIDSSIMPDAALGTDISNVIKVRTMEFDEAGISTYQSPALPAVRICWSDLVLLVLGRLISRRVELKEQNAARSETFIVDASEFVTDEAVVDFYVRNEPTTYRIAANGFDFSCLGARKGLLTSENISTLIQLLRESAPRAGYDDSFNSLRKTLEAVWPSDQQNVSSGWHRERPGKYTVGSVIEHTNYMQFLRYSRLRHYLTISAGTPEQDIPAATGPRDS